MLMELRNKVICLSMQTTTFSEAKIYFVNTWMNENNFENVFLGKKNIMLLYSFLAAFIEDFLKAII